jgi:hypothetical protein
VNVSQTGVSTGDTVDLTLSTGVSISGTLLDGASNGIEGVWVDAWSDTENVGGWDETASDGTFTIAGLKTNTTYIVSAVTGSGFVSEEVIVNTTDVTGLTLQITTGDSITGTVLSGGSVIAGVEVIVAAFDIADGSFYNSTTASATDGSYTLSNLPTGSYRIMAKAMGYADSWYGGTAYDDATNVSAGTGNIDLSLVTE